MNGEMGENMKVSIKWTRKKVLGNIGGKMGEYTKVFG